ncbi:Chitin synthase, class 7 [Puccinia graminis f. sp. tritici]|uniref:Chitin synthase export chaperone n=1 Tax=Puccinia graminis f. sp. tritici TaxID=56615 RepID=A0A5B0R7Z1_PUCGR|nr:Chitin synthase, class 7 [Puccinia graminis f. sp. tritici]
MGFSFGDFDSICSSAALIICPLMGTSSSNGNGGGGGSRMGIQPNCYARNVELNGTILFQPAVLFIHIIALIMILLMILHIKSKYTAVGRKEIVHFFYFYAVVTLSSFFLDSGIIPSSSKVYPVCLTPFPFLSSPHSIILNKSNHSLSNSISRRLRLECYRRRSGVY